MTDQKNFITDEALRKYFDSYIVLVRELEEEAAQTAGKLGVASKITKARYDQIERLKNFYNIVSKYIDSMRSLNLKMAVNYRSMQMITMHHETGLSYEKVARVLGIDTDGQGNFKKIDDAELIFREIIRDCVEIESIKLRDDE